MQLAKRLSDVPVVPLPLRNTAAPQPFRHVVFDPVFEQIVNRDDFLSCCRGERIFTAGRGRKDAFLLLDGGGEQHCARIADHSELLFAGVSSTACGVATHL